VPAFGLWKKAGTLNRQPIDAIASLTLRHWSIDSPALAGRFERPAPALPYAERAGGSQLLRLASKLARARFEIARRVR
jgi:hypothetical protein